MTRPRRLGVGAAPGGQSLPCGADDNSGGRENHAGMDPTRRRSTIPLDVREPWTVGVDHVHGRDPDRGGAGLEHPAVAVLVTQGGLVVLASGWGPGPGPGHGGGDGLQPGRMFLVDTGHDDRGRGRSSQAGGTAAVRRALQIAGSPVDLPERSLRGVSVVHPAGFSYTEEELKVLLTDGKDSRERSVDGDDFCWRYCRSGPCCSTLPAAVRPGDQSAAGRDQGGTRHLPVGRDRPGGEPVVGQPGALSAGGAGLPGDRQR